VRLRHAFGWPGNLLAFQRDARVEVKGDVFDLEVVCLAQLVDPSLADVAPRSNKVAEDQ